MAGNEAGGRAYGDDLAQTLQTLALIAAVEELLDLVPIQRAGRASRASSGGRGVEGELLGCMGVRLESCLRGRSWE